MTKLCLMACVAFAVLSVRPARADFSVIRFQDGTCRIWEKADGPPARKQGRYITLVGNFPTWVEALASMNGLHTQGQCGSIGSLQRKGFRLFPW